jgi:hypothetical protein
MNNEREISLICILYYPEKLTTKICFYFVKMANKIIKAFLFSITVIVLFSCTSLSNIAIQVAIPPKYKISPDIRSIAVLNRSLNADFINFRHDSAENLINNIKYRQTFLDSTASDSAVLVAGRAIFESQRFEVVVPLQRNIWRIDQLSKLPPLDTTFISEVCKDFKVDAVLVLERFSEKINGSFYMPWRRAIGQLDLTYDSSWNLYQPGQKSPLLSLVSGDELYWTGGLDNSHKEGYSQLPSIKDALITGGIESGLTIAGQICPNWVDETRYYYSTGDKNIDAAISLIKSNKWEEATELWMKYAEVSSKSLRSMIEYNLALAAEMTGDLDRAIEWGVKSLKTKYSGFTELYLKYLVDRRSAMAKAGM